MKQPEISVIIPTYNRAAWLKEAIDSVLQQHFQDFELLVIDDGSTDDTPDLVASYGTLIRYEFQANQGVSSARNRGIRQAAGQYIAFLDSDDCWLPDKLAQQYNVMRQHPALHICHTEEIWIRRGVRVTPKKKHQKYSGYIFERCLPLCVISPSSVMIRREAFEVVGGFDETLPACEDYDLWLRMTQRWPVYFIETPLIVKRGGHADQLSRRYWGMDRFRIQALEKLLQSGILTSDQRQLTLRELERKCRIVANGALKRQKYEEWQRYHTIPQRYQ